MPGDGIGKEVIPAALRSLRALEDVSDLRLEIETFDFGADRWLASGVALPEGQLQSFLAYDAILLGALGDPRVPGNEHAREILFGLRFGLDLYVNHRPVRCLHERLCPLAGKGPQDVDFVVFRENTEGAYVDVGGVFKPGTLDEVAVNGRIAPSFSDSVKLVLPLALAVCRTQQRDQPSCHASTP